MASFSVLTSFNLPSGETPNVGLIADPNGDLFGSTSGSVFELVRQTNGYAFTTLADFDGEGLVLVSNGDLSGTTADGTVFEIANTTSGYSPPVTLAHLASGEFPNGSNLVADANGDLFGTYNSGGGDNSGVFEIVKTATGYNPITLATFDEDHAGVTGGVSIDSNGDIFGTTNVGGSNGQGMAFEIAKTASGYASPTVIAGLPFPYGGVVVDADGDLFGTTNSGGTYGFGTVFEIPKTAGGYASSATTLASFSTPPSPTLNIDQNGDLFGMVSGTVFEIPKTANGYGGLTTLSSGTVYGSPTNSLAIDNGTLVGLSNGGASVSVDSLPIQVDLQGASSQYIVADNDGSLYVQDTVSGRDGTQTLPGVDVMQFTDGTGVFDPTGATEDVARLYQAGLGRAPDVQRLMYWTTEIDDSNIPLSTVANSFVYSLEFTQGYGTLSPSAFVNQLYQNVLGRAPDPGSDQYWTNALSSGTATEGSMLLDFAESQEYEANTISIAGDVNNAEAYRLYQAAFSRTPDAGGLSYWSSALESGESPTQVAQSFINSAEFQSDYGTLSVSDFVTTLYQNVLHRAPDAAGLQYWTNALQQGSTEASVLVSFSDSLENPVQTASATHANWVFIPNT